MAGSSVRRAGRHDARCAAQLAVQFPARQRHCRGNCDDAVRHRAGLFSGKALYPAVRSSTPLHRSRRLERCAATERSSADQRVVPVRSHCSDRAGVDVEAHGVGTQSTGRRRECGCGARPRITRRSHQDHEHRPGRIPRWNRRIVSLALLPVQLERRPFERPGIDGSGAGHLCPLEAGRLSLGLALVGRSGGVGPFPAVRGHYRRILYLQRNPVHHDVGGDDHHLFSTAQSRGGR